MGTNRSTAVVADREDFFSAGLSAVLKLQVGYSSVLQARTLSRLLKVLGEGPVELVTVADDFSAGRATQIIRQLRSRHPEVRVAVVTRSTEPKDILALLAAGAHGIIPRQNGDGTDLPRALRTIRDTGFFVPAPSELEHGATDDQADPEALTVLTHRQRQVVDLLSRGHANKIIARELGISPSTVKVHVHAAFRALGVHSRVAAANALRPL